jgi:hypothetical protein
MTNKHFKIPETFDNHSQKVQKEILDLDDFCNKVFKDAWNDFDMALLNMQSNIEKAFKKDK